MGLTQFLDNVIDEFFDLLPIKKLWCSNLKVVDPRLTTMEFNPLLIAKLTQQKINSNPSMLKNIQLRKLQSAIIFRYPICYFTSLSVDGIKIDFMMMKLVRDGKTTQEYINDDMMRVAKFCFVN